MKNLLSHRKVTKVTNVKPKKTFIFFKNLICIFKPHDWAITRWDIHQRNRCINCGHDEWS